MFFSKNLEDAKTKYLSKGYSNHKQKWKQINNVIKDSKSSTPLKICHRGKVIRKPSEIAHIANTHYINKIKTIRDNFKSETRDPMAILKNLIPRGSNELKIPLITLEDTKTLLKSLKSSGYTGYDDLSSRILKRCGEAIAPHLYQQYH